MVALVKRVLGRLIKGFFRPGFGLCFALCFGGAKAADFVVAEHLGAQCSRAAAENKVCLVYVSQAGCSFCARLERDVLRPLQKVDALAAKVAIIELPWVDRAVVDFQGRAQATDTLLKDLGVAGAPTLLFLDGQGGALAPAIVGYQSPDFFWSYFETGIQQAHDALVNSNAAR